ncbi:hypothetical protein [Pseudohoeflea suaedae]|nr:hypothetical protein [Pseudohoeflea suaedae]
MSRLFDCFIYDDEDLVYQRIAMLAPVVDTFFIMEGSHTFQGALRNPTFDLLRVPETIRHKIRHSVCDLSEAVASGDSWKVEYAQRNALMAVLDEAENDDFILLSDIDEIPFPSVLSPRKLRPALLCLLMCYFYVDYISETRPVWKRPVLFRKSQIGQYGLTFQDIRDGKMNEHIGLMPDAGLHLSYLGGVERIYAKLAKFSHTELHSYQGVDRASFEAKIKEGRDIFDRRDVWGRLDRLPSGYAEFDADFIAAHRAPADVRLLDMASVEASLRKVRRKAAPKRLRTWLRKHF